MPAPLEIVAHGPRIPWDEIWPQIRSKGQPGLVQVKPDRHTAHATARRIRRGVGGAGYEEFRTYVRRLRAAETPGLEPLHGVWAQPAHLPKACEVDPLDMSVAPEDLPSAARPVTWVPVPRAESINGWDGRDRLPGKGDEQAIVDRLWANPGRTARVMLDKTRSNAQQRARTIARHAPDRTEFRHAVRRLEEGGDFGLWVWREVGGEDE